MSTGAVVAGSILAGVTAVGLYAAVTQPEHEAPSSARNVYSSAAGRSAVAAASPSLSPSLENSSASGPTMPPTDVAPTFPTYSVGVTPSLSLTPNVNVAPPATSAVTAPPAPAPGSSKPGVAPKPAVRAPIIALDPGHSGTAIAAIDPISHLRTNDYQNVPEINEAFTVAAMVRNSLLKVGYRVVMLKQRARDTVSLSARAIRAMEADADLAVSIHDDHSQPYGQGNDVYPQKVGLYREKPDGSGRYSCRNSRVAAVSQRDSQLMAAARRKSQGLTVHGGPSDVNTSYLNRAGLYPGNLAMVQLTSCNGGTVGGRHLSPVPWVYNEMGAKRDGSKTLALTRGMLVKYAAGIAAGIKAAVPVKR